MNRLNALLLLLLGTSAHATLFTIAPGEHDPSPRKVSLFHGRKMEISFQFDEATEGSFKSDLLKRDATPDSNLIHQIYGFTDCKASRSENRAGFGFQVTNGRLQLMAFTQQGEKRNTQAMMALDPGQLYRGSISLSSDSKNYQYELNGFTTVMHRDCDDREVFGFHLYPYFNGHKGAPHPIRVSADASGEYAPALVSIPYPNPITGGRISVKVSALDRLCFFLKLYDFTGRVVWESPRSILESGSNPSLTYDLNWFLSPGTYVFVPYSLLPDGSEQRALFFGGRDGARVRIP